MNLKLKKVLQADGLLYPDIPPKGWECPKCGRVYSPTVPMCLYCGGEQAVTVTSVTGGAKVYGEEGNLKPRYCDRNICTRNEYNGISCDECEVAKYHNLEDDDSPCRDCEVGE